MSRNSVEVDKQSNLMKTIENNICVVKMIRPEIRNPLSVEVTEELGDILQEIQYDDQVKVIILTGVEGVFSAGGNLKNMNGDKSNAFETRKRLKQIHELLYKMRKIEKPIIAAVNGASAGAGVSLALACDMVIAARSSFFIQSFVKVGVIPDFGGIHLLTQLVGPHLAKELMFLGERITAEQAYQLGMINEVVDDGLLMDRVYSIAQKIAEGPSLSIGLIKQLVNQNTNSGLEQLLELEAFGQGLSFQTEDFREGVTAFMEKRAPRFKGR